MAVGSAPIVMRWSAPRCGAAATHRAPVVPSTWALRVGDDVLHEKWGEGVIIEIEGSGDRAEVTVNFRDLGEKRLLLAWAPLTKVDAAAPS